MFSTATVRMADMLQVNFLYALVSALQTAIELSHYFIPETLMFGKLPILCMNLALV